MDLKPVQVIEGDGGFNLKDVERFFVEQKVMDCKTAYQVIAIMGPQSSGKSTLLNHLFGTKFSEMDANKGRSQTTLGVWLSKSPKVPELATLVMDLEGNDGRERGEDDTNFERQTALFALAIADVLIINIWCHDIGREQGAGKPLMRTVFQVNLKLFAPEPNRKRTVLLFVIRDKSKTPVEKLVEVLEGDLQKMWESISKPPAYKDRRLDEFFEVKYAALSHYEERYEDFIADTVVLRRRFTPDGDDTLVRTSDRLPADALPLSSQQIWEVIRSQKDLNLPAHKVMVANIRCSELKTEQLRKFQEDQAWVGLAGAAGQELLPGFGQQLHQLLDSCIVGYDMEAMYFDAGVRTAKRQELLATLQELAAQVYGAQLGLLQSTCINAMERELRMGTAEAKRLFAELARAAKAEAVAKFEVQLADMEVKGFSFQQRDATLAEFAGSADACVARLTAEKTQALLEQEERKLNSQLSGPIIGMLDAMPDKLWPKLHQLANRAAFEAATALFEGLAGYELSDSSRRELEVRLESVSRARLEAHVREAALTRLSRMKDRFNEVFSMDEHRTPRTWTPKEDITKVARNARLAAAHTLAQLCVIRTPESTDAADKVDAAVKRLAREDMEDSSASSSSTSTAYTSSAAADAFDVQSATAWPGIPESLVMLQPHEVRTSWREFLSASNIFVQQAQAAQQANRLANARGPPLWALAAIAFFAFDEVMGLLYNPLLLVVALVVFLFLRTMYFELDVDAEMARGALPGVLSLSAKVRPAAQKVLSNTLESVVSFFDQPPAAAAAAPEPAHASSASNSSTSTMANPSAPGLVQRRRQEAAGDGEGEFYDASGEAAN